MPVRRCGSSGRNRRLQALFWRRCGARACPRSQSDAPRSARATNRYIRRLAGIESHEGLYAAYHDPSKITCDAVRAYALPLYQPGGRYALLKTAEEIITANLSALIERYPTIHQPVQLIWCAEDHRPTLGWPQARTQSPRCAPFRALKLWKCATRGIADADVATHAKFLR
jgi:hypothetical protein